MMHRTIRLTLLLVILSGWLQSAQGQTVSILRINEVMVANLDQFVDPSWNYGGWIEIYNPSSKTMNLQGCWISDDPENLEKIHISQSTPISGHGFVNLWFDHHDWCCPSQMNMKLNYDGGTIYLTNTLGKLIQAVEYPAALPRNSYARQTDGYGAFAWTATPTPAASNRGVIFSTERLEAPQVSHDSQIFRGTLNVTVQIPDGATLRYTTDGSTPTLTNGQTSTDGLFVIGHSHAYRFALFQDGKLNSPVVTRTYIRNDKDYTLPIISVVTDPNNLFSNELGVFVQGVNGREGKGYSVKCNWNMDWDRPVNFEYFDSTGHEVCNVEADLARCGGHSKAQTPYSFKIKAAKQYEGQNFLPAQFFDDQPYLKHKALQIRAGSNDCYCRVKDAFIQSLVRTSGIDVDLQNYQPACHFINGVYKGTINVRGPNNKHNVYANYGLDDDEIDMFEIECDSCYRQMCGTADAWQRLKTLSANAADPATYEEISQKLVDIDELCNYVAVETYLGNNDWPQNNQKGWRPIAQNGKFRFILYDMDDSFTNSNPFPVFVSRQWFTFCQLFNVPGVNNWTREVELVPIFMNLLNNDTFRKHFIDTYCLVAGSVFEPTRCEALMRQWAARVQDIQLYDDNGYNRNRSPWSNTFNLINSLKDRPSMMYNALQGYSAFHLGNVKAQKIRLSSNVEQTRLQVNDQQVPENRFDGQLFPPITLHASAPMGYKFLGWWDGQEYINTSEEISMPTSAGTLDLTACYEPISDETIGPHSIMINEVSASNSIFVNEYFKKEDWIELYNTTDQDIDIAGMYLSDQIDNPTKYCISAEGTQASTLIPAGGYKIIWCDKTETQSQLHAPFRLNNEDGCCVVLTNADQTWADTLIYCAHEGGESVGRFPDGGQKLYRMYNPTIGTANAMNLYTTLWNPETQDKSQEPAKAQATGIQDMAAHTGGISLVCSKDVLHIKSEEIQEVTLDIYTLSGQQIVQQQLTLSNGHEQFWLSMLTKGTYIARLSDNEGNQCSCKFQIK